MNRKSPRWGNRRRGPGLGPGRSTPRRGGGGGKKGGVCSFHLPSAVAATVNALALEALTTWQIRSLEATR